EAEDLVSDPVTSNDAVDHVGLGREHLDAALRRGQFDDVDFDPPVPGVVSAGGSEDTEPEKVPEAELAETVEGPKTAESDRSTGAPPQVVAELRTCLVTGYQLHVRTFTLHTVLKTVADSYRPPNPPSVDIRAARSKRDPAASASSAAPAAAAAGVAEAKHDGADEAAPAAAAGEDAVRVAPAVPSSLVKPSFDACIPEIVELLMEDLFGESAAAKEVSRWMF
ncbi:MAG: hypothetical protein AAF368_19985, partial [Planctomycetota bacterium]